MKITTVGELREALDSYDDSVPLFVNDHGHTLAGLAHLDGPHDFNRWDGTLMVRLGTYR